MIARLSAFNELDQYVFVKGDWSWDVREKSNTHSSIEARRYDGLGFVTKAVARS